MSWATKPYFRTQLFTPVLFVCSLPFPRISCTTLNRNDKDQSAMRMTLNQLLVEMDGFDQNNGVIVIGATNFPDSLDKVQCVCVFVCHMC